MLQLYGIISTLMILVNYKAFTENLPTCVITSSFNLIFYVIMTLFLKFLNFRTLCSRVHLKALFLINVIKGIIMDTVGIYVSARQITDFSPLLAQAVC
jgi:hypothetical protein